MGNSLYTGVTGLSVNQEMLDVVGNNLANSNTVGFKSQRVLFSDLVYQTFNQGTNPQSGNVGGTNPEQVGLGVHVGSIDPNMLQGDIQSTGNDFDMAIQGNGFFIVNDGTTDHYTRNGGFGVDAKNYLVDPATGFRVQRFGTVGEGSATSPAFQTPGDNGIKIPFGTVIPGKATSTITMAGNLSAADTGPMAETLTSSQPFKSGGVPATLATLLNNLDDNQVKYIAGDTLHIQGTTPGNTTVNTTLAVNGTTTMGNLITALNADFPGATASLDANGNLILKANTTGALPLGLTISDSAGDTGSTSWGNHLMAVTTAGKAGDTVTTGIQFFDTQGVSHNLNLVFQKQSNSTWSLSGTVSPSDGTVTSGPITGITFNPDGSFQTVAGSGVPTITIQLNGLANAQNIIFNFGSPNAFDGLTQVGGDSSAFAKSQDGFGAGFLNSVSVAQDGLINGVFSNGQSMAIAQLAMASFQNPAGLIRSGNNYLDLGSASGNPLIGTGLSGGRGSIQQRALESSNVDIALEFTNLIIAQRGFEVNAKTITASDQVLQDLTNIIR